MIHLLNGEDRVRAHYDVEVAIKLGLVAAVVLDRIIWSIETHINANRFEYFKDGRWWMYDSVAKLTRRLGLGKDAVKNALKRLDHLKILVKAQYNISSGQCDNWYSVDPIALKKVLDTPLVSPPPMGTPPTSVASTTPTSVASTNLSISLISKSLNPKSLNINTLDPPIEGGSVTSLGIKKLKPLKHTLQDVDLAKEWLAYASSNSRITNLPSNWTTENIAEELCKIKRVTEITHDNLIKVLRFVEADDFWKHHATSVFGLLKKSANGLRKIDNIGEAMKRKPRGVQNGSKSIDYSANPERYKHFSDDKPW